MKDGKNQGEKCRILMVGPSLDGLGGISRVVRIWQENGIFAAHRVCYVPSVTDADVNKNLFLMRNLFLFLSILMRENPLIYIQASSNRSFFRKSLFILPAILMRKRVVVHVHPSHFYDFHQALKGWVRAYTRFLLTRISGFVFLTDGMLQKFRLLYPEKSMWVLANPVDMNGMRNTGGYVRQDNRLLFLGWFIPAKGVYELVDAVALLLRRGHTVRLDFYGTKEVERLKEYVLKNELTHAVTVHGWIGPEEKVKALYESTMLVLPSHSEGVPNVILEAMATKTPIVSTFVGGLREVLRDGENAIIVREKDPVDLSEKIERCLRDRAFRERIAENAYKEASEKYDISVVKRNFADIADGLIDGKDNF